MQVHTRVPNVWKNSTCCVFPWTLPLKSLCKANGTSRQGEWGSSACIQLDEFAQHGGALLRLFQLQKMCCFRQEIVVHTQNITKVKSRQIRVWQGRVRAEDLYWTTECIEVHQNSKSTSIFYDLRFIFARTPQLVTLPVRGFAQSRSCHQIENPRNGMLEDRQKAKEADKLLPGTKPVRATPSQGGRSSHCRIEFFITVAGLAQRWIKKNACRETAASGR